jgi:hypothetical protein
MKNRTMLNTILTIAITASMLGCASQKNATATSETSSAMKVSLSVTISSDYCGGAAPSDEMIAELKQPKQFSNQKCYITTSKASKELPSDMTLLTSSASGTIEASLETGTYFVYLAEKISAKHNTKDRSATECMQWKTTPNGSFTVGSDKRIAFNLHKTCNGCAAPRM